MKRILLLLFFACTTLTISAQTALKGKVVDPDNDNEPLPFATLQLFKDGVFVDGTSTDLDGNYFFSNIDPGTYDIQADYTGYQGIRLTDIPVLSGRTNVADVDLSNSGGVVLTEVVVRGFKVPLIEQDNTTSGQTVTSEQIQNLPTRNINEIASITAGATTADEGGAVSIRGSRANATDYYVDGVRVAATSIPDSEIEQLQVITGGIEARYGDVTGGIISITTKGPSQQFSINAEAETSEGLDAFGNSLVGLAVNGPIIKRNGNSVLGFRLSGRYTYQLDDDPSAVPIFVAKDEVREELEQNPIRVVNGRPFVAADFLTEDDVVSLETRPNEEYDLLNLNGKIDARLSDAIDISISGAFGDENNQFTPNENSRLFPDWRLLNTNRNPTLGEQNYRGNFRFRHRLGGSGVADGDGVGRSPIQNANYDIQATIENTQANLEDPIHGDNFFRYGHVGRFDIDYIPVYDFQMIDEQGNPLQVDYREVVRQYDASNSSNPLLANYNNYLGFTNDQVFNNDQFGIASLGAQGLALESLAAINGRTQDLFTDSWGFWANTGPVYNLYRRTDNDRYTFQVNANFDIVPGSSDKSRHSIQFGILYEQRTERNYRINPRRLWTVARQLQNQHIPSVAPGNMVVDSVDVGGGLGFVNVLAPTVDDSDGQFYRAIREQLGVPLNQFVNVDGLSPDELSLDLFSAQELTFNNLLDYSGYDYLGNEFNGTFDDFFAFDADGRRSFNVAPNRPIYAAAYVQDKFTINKMIFRVGVRLDRFDANTRVLKDPFSLYEIIGAGDFHENFGGAKPGNIGEDYAVYTRTDNGTNVQAYRNGENWFFADGTPANNFTEIEGIQTGLVFPKYANPEVHEFPDYIKSDNFTVETSFQDYEVQFNVMPRLAFSFPISDVANFFAHYDVLLQRPPTNSLATALDYYYFVERSGGNETVNNPALRPERTVDYEAGFKTGLTESSALTITAYYKEMRDMIQIRTFAPVPIVNQYTTFDNQDFGTVKGFSLTYDLRRTANFTINANYTLQFADGTGSSADSQRGLSSRGNLRTLFPLNFDERHRLNLVLDYRFGRNANVPNIVKGLGLNVRGAAVSGRPYTATFRPDELGGAGTVGAINGARQPFTFVLNAQINKTFKIAGNSRLNVYFRVSNLLDRRNVLNVYSVTGSADDPGYLQSAIGQTQLAALATQTRPVESYLASYQWRVLNPGFFTLPRRMFLGAQFSL